MTDEGRSKNTGQASQALKRYRIFIIEPGYEKMCLMSYAKQQRHLSLFAT